MKHRSDRKIVRQVGIYSAGAQITQMITLAAAIFSRRFLGPTQMGIWATLQIVVEYSKYLTLGILQSIAREIPYYLGKGDRKTAEEIQNTIFTGTLLITWLAFAGIVIFAWLMRSRLTSQLTWGLLLVSVIIILQRLNDLLIQLIRSYQLFRLATSQMILSAIFNAVLVAFFTYHFKIFGFIWATILSLGFNVVYILWRSGIKLRWLMLWDRFFASVRFGLPLLMIGVLVTIFQSIDKIMIVKFIGFEGLGHYTIALMVGTYLGNFINSVAIVLIPHFQEKFGTEDRPAALDDFLGKSARASAWAMPFLIGGAWIFAPWFVSHILPQYTSGIPAMKYLSLGVLYLALAQPYQDFLVTIKKHYGLFPVLLATMAVAALLNLYVISHGYGIAGVAAATAFAMFLKFTATYFLSIRYLPPRQSYWGEYLMYVGCGFHMTVILLLLDRWLPGSASSIPTALLQGLCFFLLASPFMVALFRKFSLGHLIGKFLAQSMGRAKKQ